VTPSSRKALVLFVIVLAIVPVALLVGLVTGSQAAFVAVMAVGLLASILLRARLR
jgi:hypothetical protein